MNVAEKITKMGLVEKWLYAFKIKSWPKLLVPFLFGQGFGYSQSENPSFLVFSLGFLFTCFLLGYIVLLNDYADINVDTIKRKLFPNDCSPKTIPDSILSKSSVLGMGILMGVLSVIVAGVLESISGKGFIIVFSFLCVLVFAAYSLPPIRLNYRGGGEFLEMMGVGLLLPFFHFYLQAGLKTDPVFYLTLVMSTIFALSSALASGLSDEESDRIGGKNTIVTFFGNHLARNLIDSMIIVNYFLLLFFCYFFKYSLSIFVISFLISYFLYHIFFIFKFSKFALTNEFDSQRFYKDHIHKLIWGSICLITLFVNFNTFFSID